MFGMASNGGEDGRSPPPPKTKSRKDCGDLAGKKRRLRGMYTNLFHSFFLTFSERKRAERDAKKQAEKKKAEREKAENEKAAMGAGSSSGGLDLN